MYIGAYDGLYIYDGGKTISFSNSIQNQNSILPGPINNVVVDKQKNIWTVHNPSGITKISSDLKSFKRFNDRTNPILKNLIIENIQLDPKGTVWFQSNSFELFTINNQTDHIVQEKRLGREVLAINLNNKDSIWFFNVNSKSISVFSFKTQKRIDYPLGIQNYRISRICKLNELLYLFEKDKIYIYDINTRKIKKEIALNGILINSIKENKKLNYILACSESSGFFKLKDTTFESFGTYDLTYPFLNKNTLIHDIEFDQYNNIWLSTERGLKYIAEPTKINFRLLNQYSLNEPQLKIENVRSIFRDSKKNIFIGMSKMGLTIFKPNGRSINYLFNDTKMGFLSNTVNHIGPEIGNKIFLGCGDGLKYFDTKRNKISLLIEDNPRFKDIPNIPIWDINIIKDSVLIISFKKPGLYFLNLKNGHQSYIPINDNGERDGVYIWKIFKYNDNDFILGTSQGLYHLQIKNNLKRIIQAPQQVSNWSNNTSNEIWDIYKHPKSKSLWLCTSQNGLVEYNPIDGKINTFSTNKGLPSNTLCSIESTNDSMIWVSTVNGIFSFNINSKKVVNIFNIRNGLASRRYYFKSSLKYDESTILFGKSDGITYFNPNKLNTVPDNDVVNITNILSSKKLNVDSILIDNKITLNPDNNIITFIYSLNNFAKSKSKNFRYRLLGLYNNWIFAEERKNITFTNLPQGNYIFEVECTDNTAYFSSNKASFQIKVLPPFYKKTWFILLIIFSILTLLFIVFYFLNRSRTLTQKRLQLEITALRSQLNPHFVFNSLVSLQHFIIGRQDDKALSFLTRFAKLMRMILENSKKELIPIQDEINFLKLYTEMENNRFESKIDFQIINNCIGKDAHSYLIPSMIIQPIIENAIQHGQIQLIPNGFCKIEFYEESDSIIVKIEDNGVGRKLVNKMSLNSTPLKKSMGLNLIEQRVKLLQPNKEKVFIIIDKDDKIESGLVIIMKLPIKIPKVLNKITNKNE